MREDPMTITAGTQLGSYKILSPLGAGGMGEVYLAEDTRLRRKVALKVLPESLAQDKDRLRRFEQEAFAASALNHPNILTVFEIGQSDDTYFIATEFIEGATLRQHLAAQPMKLSEALDIAIQVASALTAAHAAGIVHRDIKPENIMRRTDGYLKVLDFGLAKLTEPRTADPEAATKPLVDTDPGVVMGTVSYMSPEQARGLEVDARTDIFSLGVVLYEMVTGRAPFAGVNALDTVAAVLDREPAPLKQHVAAVPDELQRIVGKALRKHRDERYQTARDLLNDLKDLKEELAFTAKLERAGQTEKNEAATVPPNAMTTAAGAAVPTTSSAKIILGEIKRHKLGAAFVLVLLLVVVAALGYFAFFARRQSGPIDSIAVMPFVNASGNADVEYLSDGMTETLISSLSQLPKLNVKARSSVFRYKGKETTPQTIGNELNVQAILHGRVVQRGDQLTLSLELIDAQTENVIWSEQYNRKQTDLVTLQGEIARDVSSKLKTKLSGAGEVKWAKNFTAPPEAYTLYLQGRFHWNKRTPRDLQKAVEYFQQAGAMAPNYGLAFAGLADAYILLAAFGGAPPREAMPKAKEAALRALALDQQLAEPHTAFGHLAQYYDYDLAEAERHFKRAIEVNPNYSAAHEFYGTLLFNLGRYEEAEAQFRRALDLEPLSLGTNRMYGEALLFARRYDESIAQLKKTIELDESFASAHRSLGRAYLKTKNYAGHVEGFARHYELIGEPQYAALMRESFASGGWKGYLQAMTGEKRPVKYFFPFYAAMYYAELGEKDKAFAELNKTYQERLYYMAWLKTDPCLDSLRGDPRFQELLKKVGFPP
jgi:serine/threonine-protein kinase